MLRRARSGEVNIRRCAWCERFQIGQEWLHLKAIASGQLQITEDLMDRATHGICDECFARQQADAATGRTSRRSMES